MVNSKFIHFPLLGNKTLYFTTQPIIIVVMSYFKYVSTALIFPKEWPNNYSDVKLHLLFLYKTNLNTNLPKLLSSFCFF